MKHSRIFWLAAMALVAVPCVAQAQIPTGAPEALFPTDIHAAAGLTCATCHTKTAAGLVRAHQADRHRAALRALPQRRHLHAEVQARSARGPVRPVPDQHARRADGEGRDARSDLHRLPRRARHPGRVRRRVVRLVGARGDHVRALPFQPRADDRVQPHRRTRGLEAERARRGPRARRLVGADLQHVPRRPQRAAGRRHQYRRGLRHVPRARGGPLPVQPDEDVSRRTRPAGLRHLPPEPQDRAAAGQLRRPHEPGGVRRVPRARHARRGRNHARPARTAAVDDRH